MTDNTKECTQCKQIKHIDEFYRRKTGYTEPHCKKCRNTIVNEFNKMKRDEKIKLEKSVENNKKKLVMRGNHFYWE